MVLYQICVFGTDLKLWPGELIKGIIERGGN
jgi:hypothetical protein